MNVDGPVGASRAAREPAALFTLRVPAEPAMLAPLRSALEAWLRRLRWSDEECRAIVLAVAEACTNVIEHAYPFDGAGEIELSGREHNEGLRRHVVIAVDDQGRWCPPSPPGADCRGLALMRALMHRINVHARADGTRVSMISCAVPCATTPDSGLDVRGTASTGGASRPSRPTARTVNRDRHVNAMARAALAKYRAAVLCDRARILIGKAQTIAQGRSAR